MSKKSITAPVDPRDDDAPIGHRHDMNDTIEDNNIDKEEQEEEDDDVGYDILPSNGPGLVGDDGEEILPADDEDDEDE